MYYLTAEEVKAYQSEALNEKTDEQLKRLIGLYSNMVDEYCGTSFQPAKKVFAADVAGKIRLPDGPLLEVEAVLYHGGVLCENKDYYVYPEKGIVEMANPSAFGYTKRSLYISYSYGYREVPAIVRKVILDLMKLDVQSDSHNALASQENWDGEYSYQRNTAKTAEDLREDILALLDIFKQPEYQAVVTGVGDVRARLL